MVPMMMTKIFIARMRMISITKILHANANDSDVDITIMTKLTKFCPKGEEIV